MPSRINVVVALTPINEIPALANEYVAHEMVDAQVGGSIASSKTYLLGPGEMVRVGSLNGTVYSASARYAFVSQEGINFESFFNPTILYVRNTGKQYSTPSGLSNLATTGKVTVSFDNTVIATLYPGEALMLPLHTGDISEEFDTCAIWLGTVSKDHIAVEALLIG